MVIMRTDATLQTLPSAVRRKARAKLARCLTAKIRAQLALADAQFNAAEHAKHKSDHEHQIMPMRHFAIASSSRVAWLYDTPVIAAAVAKVCAAIQAVVIARAAVEAACQQFPPLKATTKLRGRKHETSTSSGL